MLIKEIQESLNCVEKYLEEAPEGSLKVQQKSGKLYYYHQFIDKKTNQCVREYIPKKNQKLTKKLAQKGYYIHAKPILKRNLAVLQEFKEKYNMDDLERVYDELIDGKKCFVTPIQMSVKERLRIWNNEHIDVKSRFPEKLIFQTERGEMVRSKSELIIANMLYKNKNDMLYKYERPLTVVIDGREGIIYPDFTIINIHTGKITYWEHAGKMDDTRYAVDFVRKVNTYMENGILPGRDIIFTYETLNNPICIQGVISLIEALK